jgi:molybdate transport system regulatory protein
MSIPYNRRMEKEKYNLHAELTVRVGETLLANTKRIELLRQIDLIGNLTQAAKIAGYSYKGAWDSIDQMATLSGGTLLERHAGGKGGGGTELTERGKQLLKNFTLIQSEHQRFIARLNKLANGLSNDYALLNEIAMKTSARNQFAGIIESIHRGPVNDEIHILVNDKLTLVSSITHESCTELQLAIGAKVFALIKASTVTLRAAGAKEAPLLKNEFLGVAHKFIKSKSRTEVSVRLDGELELIATVEVQSASALKSGAKVIAAIEPSSVIIGVAA